MLGKVKFGKKAASVLAKEQAKSQKSMGRALSKKSKQRSIAGFKSFVP